MKKRILSLILALVLVCSCGLAEPAFAAEYSEDELAERILYVKNLFDIGEEYTEFSQNFYSYSGGNDTVWSFYWNTGENYKGGYSNINVSLDSRNHITSYYKYANNEDRKIPKKLASEYEGVIADFLKKVAPEISGHVALEDTYCYLYNNSYSYTYRRCENGIVMPDNYVDFEIDYTKGEVVSFYTNWNYDVTIPSASKILTKEEAAAKLGTTLELELQYLSKWDEGKETVFLAYAPNQRYYAVDANTGKVYDKKNTFEYADDTTAESDTADMINGAAAKAEEAAGGAVLSDAEREKIAELVDLISEDEAIKVVTGNKQLLLDKNLNLTNAYLNTWGDNYVWNINMRDARPVDYDSYDTFRAYAGATVDAKTGELLSFYASVKNYYDYYGEDGQTIDLKYGLKECNSRFEKFLKTVAPEKYAQTRQVLKNNDNGYVIYYDYENDKAVYGGRNFNYVRYADDIPFYGNSLSGSVDRITGKIYSYNSYWSDVEFPAAEGVITADAARDSYLGLDGFGLKYELTTRVVYNEETYESKTEYKVRLVYVTDIYGYIDAFTGELIGYDGRPIEGNTVAFEYTDIKGNKYEKAIRILASLNCGFEGSKFEPDKVITAGEFESLISSIYYFNGTTTVKGNKDKKLTRQVISKLAMDAVGLTKLAKLDIYKVNYSDAAKVGKSYVGSVALSQGLGIWNIKAGSKFKPTKKVTRGEAAQIIVNLLSIQQSM